MPPDAARLRLLRYAIVALLAAGVVALVAGPLRGTRDDIGTQRETVQDQLVALRQQVRITADQLETARAQLRLLEQQRDVTTEQLEVARRQLAIAEQQLAVSRQLLTLAEQGVGLQRALLRVAEDTLTEVRQINQKTPDATPSG